jgi:decaprenylphospho-beta-D-ribofuranose 2-oxidase
MRAIYTSRRARRHRQQRLRQEFNEYALRYGGRVYLAKDAFSRPEHIRAMYPRLDEWQQVCRRYDPDGRIRSALAQRCAL